LEKKKKKKRLGTPEGVGKMVVNRTSPTLGEEPKAEKGDLETKKWRKNTAARIDDRRIQEGA